VGRWRVLGWAGGRRGGGAEGGGGALGGSITVSSDRPRARAPTIQSMARPGRRGGPSRSRQQSALPAPSPHQRGHRARVRCAPSARRLRSGPAPRPRRSRRWRCQRCALSRYLCEARQPAGDAGSGI
jgi:hypothetical protein